MFGKKKTNKELDNLIEKTRMYMSNNYKDAAQEAFKNFRDTFEKLKRKEGLSEKQVVYYNDINDELKKLLEKYSHKN